MKLLRALVLVGLMVSSVWGGCVGGMHAVGFVDQKSIDRLQATYKTPEFEKMLYSLLDQGKAKVLVREPLTVVEPGDPFSKVKTIDGRVFIIPSVLMECR